MKQQLNHQRHTISIRQLVLQTRQKFGKMNDDRVLSFHASLIFSNHLSLFDEGATIMESVIVLN